MNTLTCARSLPLAVLFLAACAVTPGSTRAALGPVGGPLAFQDEDVFEDAPPPPQATTIPVASTRGDAVQLEFVYSELDLGKVTIEGSNIGKNSMTDVSRLRRTLRGNFGAQELRGFVQVFSEDFAGLFDNYGLGGGVTGSPVVHEVDENLSLTVPYRAGANLVVGENDADDFGAYLELEAEAAIATRFTGFQMSLGAYLTTFNGVIDNKDDNDGDDSDEFDATNAGLFMEVLFSGPALPVLGSIRILGGNTEGLLLSIGASF